MTLSALEIARNEQMARNRAHFKANGLEDAAEELAQAKKKETRKLSSVPRRPSGRAQRSASERRQPSARNEGARINYNEESQDDFFGNSDSCAHYTKRCCSWAKRRRTHAGSSVPAVYLDEEAARQARLQAGIELDDEGEAAVNGGPRGIDSGKGVRVQNGVVYDSVMGVTCHWCRQKTLKAHVTCTDPDCGQKARLPKTFCKTCLRNRHGEDWEAARATGKWVCPPCRKSCGPGCTNCCNCGPCRKKLGMAPTGQIKAQVVADGFDNAHDWLVYRTTKEEPDVIAARKYNAPWGAWLHALPVDHAEEDEHGAPEEGADAEQGAAVDAGAQGAGQEDMTGEQGSPSEQQEGMDCDDGNVDDAGDAVAGGDAAVSKLTKAADNERGKGPADAGAADVFTGAAITSTQAEPCPAVEQPAKGQQQGAGKVRVNTGVRVDLLPLRDVSKKYAEANTSRVQASAPGQGDTEAEAVTDADFNAFVHVFNQQKFVSRIEAAAMTAPVPANGAAEEAPKNAADALRLR